LSASRSRFRSKGSRGAPRSGGRVGGMSAGTLAGTFAGTVQAESSAMERSRGRGRGMAAVVTPIRPVGGPCLRLLSGVDAELPSPGAVGSRWRRVRVRLVAGRVCWSLLDVARGGGHLHISLFGVRRSVRLCRGRRGLRGRHRAHASSQRRGRRVSQPTRQPRLVGTFGSGVQRR
jgi:hypothetical protein